MNTGTPASEKKPAMIWAVCRQSYLGYWLYETGEGVAILVGHEWKLFDSIDAAKAYILAALSKVVTS